MEKNDGSTSSAQGVSNVQICVFYFEGAGHIKHSELAVIIRPLLGCYCAVSIAYERFFLTIQKYTSLLVSKLPGR